MLRPTPGYIMICNKSRSMLASVACAAKAPSDSSELLATYYPNDVNPSGPVVIYDENKD